MFLPPNCTALIQPMDQNAIRILKLNYRKRFLCHILASLEENDDFGKCIKNFTLKDAVILAANAWNKVKQTTLQSCWKKILLAENEWETEDELPLAQLKEKLYRPMDEIINLLNDVAPYVYFNSEINEWIDDENEFPDEKEDQEN